MALDAAAQAFLKRKGLTAAQWKAKTSARWAANHPAPLFPSTAISPAEDKSVMQQARKSVQATYAANPLPSVTTYLQPFADAITRAQSAGADYSNYLRSSVGEAQNLSGAYNAALTGGIQQGQATTQMEGGSGTGIPAASASLIPAAAVGSSAANYLNALQPYVGASVNSTVQQVNDAQAKALADYRNTEAQRRAEISDAVQKLYSSGLDSLASQKKAAHDAAVTDYLALGKTAYQQGQLQNTAAKNASDAAAKTRSLDIQQQRANAYSQSVLDAKRKSAKASGIDLKPAYDQLFVTTTSSPSGVPTGPRGQSGRKYQTVVSTTNNGVAVAPDKKTSATIMYGETVPKVGTTTRVDPKTGNTITTTVTAGDYVYAPKRSSSSSRKATAASWDRAVAYLRAKYPGRITASWLATNFPPRPSGT